ncbi:paramyosin [Aricia agestis]|uniref:paramyosin n=1 Tax=Aricia agestis TaxID=91739 RepID=UPI001C202D43|nr:paramyosin [Aricia agestis]
MPEHPKLPQSASPVARSGGGDISEKELSRERCILYATPTTAMRHQRAHPKKQLFSAPVNKFTAKTATSGRNLSRIRSCLDEYKKTPVKAMKIQEKAVSMEDLTPSKRIKNENNDNRLSIVRSPKIRTADEDQAAARVARFMVVAAWRRRRQEIRCLRKTLECQANSSERLRIQVSTLKSLLDSDNTKVRLAIRELERLKLLLREKEVEKALSEREKQALQQDICSAEDRAAEMAVGWRNCRNELENVQKSLALAEEDLRAERTLVAEVSAQRVHAYNRLALLQKELANHEEMLSQMEEEVTSLKREARDKQEAVEKLNDNLNFEIEARTQLSRENAALQSKLSRVKSERDNIASLVATLRERLTHTQLELASTRRRVLWPRPVMRLFQCARSWLHPLALSEALMWSLFPTRYGC